MEEFGLDDWQEDIFNLEKRNKKIAERSREELQQLLMDYRYVFSGRRGQRVFWDLLEQSYVFYPYEQHNASSYVKEGRREVGLYLLAAVGFRPSEPAALAALAQSLMQIASSKMEEKDE